MAARTTKKTAQPKNTVSSPAAEKIFFFIAGSDEGAVKERAHGLFHSLLPEWGGEFAAEVIDGAAESSDQVGQRVNAFVGAIQSMPMFAPRKLVWLKSVNFMGDDLLGRSASADQALETLTAALADGLPVWCAAIVSAIAPDKRRAAFKTLSKLGHSEVFDKLDESRAGWEEDAAGRIETALRGRGIKADEEAILLFIQRVGADTRAITIEVEKLDLYLGDRRRLTEEDVALMVAPARGAVVFELGNAIAAGRTAHALDLLDTLFAQKETAVGILLASIVPTVRNLLLAKDLMERYKIPRPVRPFDFTRAVERLPAEATAHLARKKDGTLSLYPLGLAAVHAGRFTAKQLRQALRECAEANVRIVTSQTDPRTLLAGLIVSVAGGK